MIGRSKLKEYLIAIGLILLLTVPLVLAIRGIVQEVIVIPLLYVLWIGRLLLRSIPQVVFWFVFLVMACLLALGSLVRWEKPRLKPRLMEGSSSGQVRVWARRIRLINHRGYVGWYFGQHVERLIVDVLAYREGLNPRQIRRRIKTGDLDVPSEVQAYFGIVLVAARQRRLFSLLSRLRPHFRRRTREALPATGGLDRVVRFLEDQLEV